MEECSSLTQAIIHLSPLNIAISIVGIIGNVLTCIVIGRNQKMRTAPNAYLCTLAAMDLFMLVGIGITLLVGWTTCTFSCVSNIFHCGTSIMLIVFYGERNIYMNYPDNPGYHNVCSTTMVRKIIIGVCNFAVLTSIPECTGAFWGILPNDYFVPIRLGMRSFVFLIAVVLISKHLIDMWMKNPPLQNPSLSQQALLFLLFFVRWAPLTANDWIEYFQESLSSETLRVLLSIYVVYSTIFYMTFSMCPSLYIMSSEFREAFKDMMFCKRTANFSTTSGIHGGEDDGNSTLRVE